MLAACKPQPRNEGPLVGTKPGIRKEFYLTDSLSLPFRWIPPGKLPARRGTPAGVSEGFWLAETETTVAVWQHLMGRDKTYYPEELVLPVAEVSWNDCDNFVRKLRSPGEGWCFRLPDDAQWEHACRAGSLGDFYGDPVTVGWLEANAGGTVHPVGLLPANAWGLRDMHGNVAEWCFDGPGPNSHEKIIRGGSWDSDLSAAASVRSSDTPSLRINRVGFRLSIVRTHS